MCCETQVILALDASCTETYQCVCAFNTLQILEQAWPYFGEVMEKTFREKIEPKIRAKNTHLKTCTFSKIHFGEKVGQVPWTVVTRVCSAELPNMGGIQARSPLLP